jgi:hypothetical protein
VVDTANGEEDIFNEEHTWMDEVITSVEAQNLAFEIKSKVDIRVPIVMQVLLDEREVWPSSDITMVNITPVSLVTWKMQSPDAGWTLE